LRWQVEGLAWAQEEAMENRMELAVPQMEQDVEVKEKMMVLPQMEQDVEVKEKMMALSVNRSRWEVVRWKSTQGLVDLIRTARSRN
jgi:hypothetical protein